ncbi:unannotated protein [freshwater metagenome]|uniref:Unannotated protein n=1 Tax=freshwater metagenome TaxID=449393 RepID=A0A6J7UKK7_9ZZZZ
MVTTSAATISEQLMSAAFAAVAVRGRKEKSAANSSEAPARRCAGVRHLRLENDPLLMTYEFYRHHSFTIN